VSRSVSVLKDVEGERRRRSRLPDAMDGGERIRADAVHINAKAFELSCAACLM
jgi:hypothetical protein